MVERPKNIRVRDRATLFNLLIGLNGYTVCSGVIDEDLNSSDIVAVPLDEEGEMEIGILCIRNFIRVNLEMRILRHCGNMLQIRCHHSLLAFNYK